MKIASFNLAGNAGEESAWEQLFSVVRQHDCDYVVLRGVQQAQWSGRSVPATPGIVVPSGSNCIYHNNPINIFLENFPSGWCWTWFTTRIHREYHEGVAVLSRRMPRRGKMWRLERDKVLHVLVDDVLGVVSLVQPGDHFSFHERDCRRVFDLLRAQVKPIVLVGDVRLTDLLHPYGFESVVQLTPYQLGDAQPEQEMVYLDFGGFVTSIQYVLPYRGVIVDVKL